MRSCHDHHHCAIINRVTFLIIAHRIVFNRAQVLHPYFLQSCLGSYVNGRLADYQSLLLGFLYFTVVVVVVVKVKK